MTTCDLHILCQYALSFSLQFQIVNHIVPLPSPNLFIPRSHLRLSCSENAVILNVPHKIRREFKAAYLLCYRLQ